MTQNLASALHTRMSHAVMRSTPAPTHWPAGASAGMASQACPLILRWFPVHSLCRHATQVMCARRSRLQHFSQMATQSYVVALLHCCAGQGSGKGAIILSMAPQHHVAALLHCCAGQRFSVIARLLWATTPSALRTVYCCDDGKPAPLQRCEAVLMREGV